VHLGEITTHPFRFSAGCPIGLTMSRSVLNAQKK